jgi:hypothetical protein
VFVMVMFRPLGCALWAICCRTNGSTRACAIDYNMLINE